MSRPQYFDIRYARNTFTPCSIEATQQPTINTESLITLVLGIAVTVVAITIAF